MENRVTLLIQTVIQPHSLEYNLLQDKKRVIRYKKMLSAYGISPAMISGRRNQQINRDALEMKEEILQLHETLSKMRKNVANCTDERVQFKTKIARLENEVQRKDKQFEELLNEKVLECSTPHPEYNFRQQ